MNITKEEALKIASISRIALQEDEIEPVVKQLAEVLEYAQRVQELALEVPNVCELGTNQMRADVVQPSHPEIILSRAPEREENYFVVPRIIEK